jgi:hypothetical protein
MKDTKRSKLEIIGRFDKEEHGNRSLQSQISQSASVDLRLFQLEYLELQKSN